MMHARFGRSLSLPLALVVLAVTAAAGQSPACPSGDDAVGHLGVVIACDCTVNPARSSERPWQFRSALHVAAVEAGGVADGLLQVGDSITAVDGVAITTAAGAARLAALRPGEQVTLSVVRGRRQHRVRITASLICPHDSRAIGSYAPAVRAPSAAARSAPEAGGAPAAADRSPGGSRRPTAAVPMLPDLLPAGRLGFALTCSRCGWERAAGDRHPRWHSEAPPRVYAIEPDGPAARAGIQPGDVLLRVDGQAITSRAAGEALGAATPGQRLTLELSRAGAAYTTRLEVLGRAAADLGNRYSGSIGSVLVDVSSAGAAEIVVSEGGRVMEIRTGDAVIRLRTGGDH
jgi:membrane-associated protease RseP (regulator of RpoE activity)